MEAKRKRKYRTKKKEEKKEASKNFFLQKYQKMVEEASCFSDPADRNFLATWGEKAWDSMA